MNYGENIKKIRERHGLTQEDFGERLGVSQSYIAHVEHGRKLPSRELISLIARTFKTSTDEIFFGSDYLLNIDQDTA